MIYWRNESAEIIKKKCNWKFMENMKDLKKDLSVKAFLWENANVIGVRRRRRRKEVDSFFFPSHLYVARHFSFLFYILKENCGTSNGWERDIQGSVIKCCQRKNSLIDSNDEHNLSQFQLMFKEPLNLIGG